MAAVDAGNEPKMAGLSRTAWIAIGLAIATLLAYSPVFGNRFVMLDDPLYLTNNSRVQDGLSVDSVRWAFTTLDASNWHPLTWLSHMLDVSLFGLDPAGHHAMNLFFHILNSLCLFVVLRRMTGEELESALVAALFALHPLHVESVAWAAERKDVLSTFFLVATVGAYARYADRKGAWNYLLAFVLFALGLLAKPMLVTTPFLLLLLDFWPLGRREGALPHLREMTVLRPEAVARAVLDKVPFLLLAAGSSAVTLVAQSRARAVVSMVFPLDERLRNAVVACVRYIGKGAFPESLAVLYPHDAVSIPAWKVACAGLFLAGVTFACVRLRRKMPFLAVGWFWFLGTLVPVIGIVQVGEQSMADRYSYVPFIGLFIVVAWGGAACARAWRVPPRAVAVAAFAWLLLLSAVTWRQAGYWRDTITLARHAVSATGNPSRMRQMLGIASGEKGQELLAQGKTTEAIDFLLEADRYNPYDPLTVYSLGIAFARSGKLAEARPFLEKAVDIEPGWPLARMSLGLLYHDLGEKGLAADQYREVLRIDPSNAAARARLGG